MRPHPVALLILAVTIGPVAAQGPSRKTDFTEQFEYGKLALSQGKYRDAIAAFKRATEIQSDCYTCYYGMASAQAELKDARNAIKSASKSVDSAQNNISRAAAHNLKGTILSNFMQSPKEFSAIETEFRLAVQDDPSMALYHFNLARVLIREQKDDAAKPELEACLAAEPDPELERKARIMIADPSQGRETFSPEFQLTTINGDDLSLHQFTGKVLVLDFWATWCPPCRESVSELKALTRKYPSDKLVLISISVDEDDRAWRDFVKNRHMDWSQYRDVDRRLRNTFGVNKYPTYLIIDGDGIIRQRMIGMNPHKTIVYRLQSNLEQMFQANK